MTRFDFEFSSPLSWPLAFLGVTPWTAHVDVTDEQLAIRFGPWSMTTPLSNVEGATVTGPYLPFKALGAHISLADRGVTFGSSWHRGVCVRFRRPVPGAEPTGLVLHPAVTVTVAEPERLAELLEREPSGAPGDGDELRRVLQPVATPPRRRSSSRSTPGPRTRTPRKRSAPPPEAHPTPADMPQHTDTEKVPGVTPPADEGLPGPDDVTG